MSTVTPLRDGEQAATLWQEHPDSLPSDPQVWWWRDLMKAINSISMAHSPMAQYAAMRLAGVYWAHGSLPEDPARCAKLIRAAAMTMRKHWDEVLLILNTNFVEMPMARRVVVAQRINKVASGRAGGHKSAASTQQTRCKDAASLQAASAEIRQLSETEPETEINQRQR